MSEKRWIGLAIQVGPPVQSSDLPLERVPGAEQEVTAGMVIEGRQVELVKCLMLELIGQVDAFEGQIKLIRQSI